MRWKKRIEYTKDNLREFNVRLNTGYSANVKAHRREVVDGALILTDRSSGHPVTVGLFAPGAWTYLTADGPKEG